MRDFVFELQRFDVIRNNSHYQTLEGGAENDTIISYGDAVSINGGNGDNDIFSAGSFVSIVTGAGNDSVRTSVGSSLDKISTGDGLDTIIHQGDSATIQAGKGGDRISLYSGSGCNLILYNEGDGSDYIQNFHTNDTLQIGGGTGTYSTTKSGDDILVHVGSSKITLKGAATLSAVKIRGSYRTPSVSKLITLTENADTYINDLDGATVLALAGNDKITNTAANVSINGGDGNDTLKNEGGSKVTISGGNDNDRIWNSGNSVLADGGAGDDSIYNEASNSSILGGAGNDTVNNSGGIKLLIDTGDGNDSIYSYNDTSDNNAQLTIKAGAGNDNIANWGADNSILDGGADNDTVANYSGYYVTMKGGDGNDSIRNHMGQNVTIDAGAGNDTVTINGATVSVNAGAGDDLIKSSATNVTINGGTGNDRISLNGDAKNNLIEYTSGDGNDTVWGFNTTSTLQIGGGTGTYSTTQSGDDIIVKVGDGSVLLKGAATLSGVKIAGKEVEQLLIKLTENADTYTNNLAKATVLALAGDDYLVNNAASVSIDGGLGNDYIYNKASQVSILGGAGNDTVNNSIGANVLIDTGDGNDSIYGYNDTFDNNAQLTIKAGAGNDNIANWGADKSIFDGGADDDTVANYSGYYVTMKGGDGNDSIRNHMGQNVTMDGGAGDDTLYSYNSTNVSLNGGAGNDRISLNGDAKNNLIEYTSGDGNDTVWGFNATSTLKIGGGTGTYSTTKSGNDIVVKVGDGSVLLKGAATLSAVKITGKEVDPLLITLTENADTYTNSLAGATVLALGDNDSLINEAANVSIDGMGGNDRIYNSSLGANSTIEGGAGNDTIMNFALNVLISGGDGNDNVDNNKSNVTILGGAGKDSILNYDSNSVLVDGGEDNDSIVSQGDNVTIKGGAGNDILQKNIGSNVTIDAGDGDDRIYNYRDEKISINSGAGNDYINSSKTSSLVTINGGVGNDTVSNESKNSFISGGDGIDSIHNSGSNVTIDGGLGNDSIYNDEGRNLSIEGGEGNDSIYSYCGYKSTVSGGKGDDTIFNNGGSALVEGGDGKDIIKSSNATNVTINGGAGTDDIWNTGSNVIMNGGADNDTLWNLGAKVMMDGGDGNDSIRNDGVKAPEFTVGDKGTINGGAGDDTINNYSGSYNTIDGGDGSDSIITSDGLNNVINGGAGNDYIRNNSDSDDTITGGAGADRISLAGDSTNNLIEYTAGDGNDTVWGFKASDTLQIGGGTGTYSTTKSGNDIIVTVGNGKISLVGAASLESVQINGVAKTSDDNPLLIMLTEGKDTYTNALANATILALGGDDKITNTGASVSTDLGAGDDYIDNGGANSTIYGGAGEDAFYNHATNVLLDGGADDDVLRTTASKITMLGGAGNDLFNNEGSSVLIDGGDGNDHVISYEYTSNLSINGGAGNDNICLYSHTNTIKVDAGTGNDTVSTGTVSTKITINADEGNDLIVNKSTQDVTITLGDGNDTIRLEASVKAFTVTDFEEGDVIELNTAVSSLTVKNDSLVAGNVTIGGIDSVADNQEIWDVEIDSATFKRMNTGGAKLSEDGKIITFEESTDEEPEELFTLNGLKPDVTAEELKANVTVSGSTVTVGKNVLGDQELTVDEGWTIALADDVPKSEDIPANWSVNGSTATYTDESTTEGYRIVDGVVVYYDASEGETFTLTGIKKNLTAATLNENVKIEGSKVTLNENVLDKGDVTISDDWTLALADDVPQSEELPENWDISSAGKTSTAIYIGESTTEGYTIDEEKIVYNGGTTGTTFTLTGLANNFTSDAVSVEGKTIILSPDALGEANVTLTTTDGYALALNEDCPTVEVMNKSWTLNGTTATYRDAGKTGGYKLANSKSVTYTAPVDGKALLMVKGLADGLEVVNGEIAGLGVEGKVLTVTPEVVGEDLSVSAGYKVVFDAGDYGGSKFTGTTGKDALEVNGSGLEIECGKGNDAIVSNGDGGNVYLFTSKGGKDVVKGFGDDDTIKITDGSKVSSSVKGNDVIIKVGSGSITLKDAVNGTHITVVDADEETLIDNVFYKDRIVKDNGATLTSAFKNNFFTADEEVNAVDGSAVSRKFSLTGGDEDNTLIGGTGSNFINGGGGENILTGGKGTDTFVAGNGNDTITDYGNGSDKISLASPLIDFSIDGKDVILNFDDDKSLTIQNGAGKKISLVQNGKTSTELFTAQGKTNTQSSSIMLSAEASDYEASSTMVTIDGSLTDSVWIGGNTKANKIFGGGGEDTLFGGKGSDTLTGGKGDDIFVFESGKDVITDYNSYEDKISLKGAATSETLNAKGDVVLKVGTDSLTIKKVDDLEGRMITFTDGSDNTTKTYFSEKIVGSDGVTLQSNFKANSFEADSDNLRVDASAVTKTLTITGGEDNNTLIGGKGANLLNGGDGNDLLIGNGGADTFVYSSGDDTIGDYETKDRVSLTSALKDFSLENDDVIIGFDEGSLTISKASGKEITFVETGGKTKINVFAADGIFDTKKTAMTLAADTSKFTATKYSNLVTINGGLVSTTTEIVGNAKDNLIYAGTNGGTINGGKGNDKLWGDTGADTFIYESGGGKDTIYGFGNEDALQIGEFTATVKGKDISFKIGSQTDAVILKNSTATNFNVNGDTYQISNGNFTKK